MKKYFLFFLIATACLQSFSQSDCSDSNSDLIYAYSHVKSAYDSNNVTHLKYFSKKSLDAFERTKKNLESCGCDKAYNFAYDAAELLSKVPDSKTFEDGRFYVKRARTIAKDVINELEICTQLNSEDEALVELENEQFKLKQQQIELQLKEEDIKLKMVEREAKELHLKKEQLIRKNELAINANVKTLNEVLDACECDSEVLLTEHDKDILLSKDLAEIKAQYLNIVKDLTSNYLKKLSACND